MTDILRRSLAPVSDKAWARLDEEAIRVLKSFLSARTVTDFSGPHGWDLACVNLGRLTIAKRPAENGVTWGRREMQPLIEARVPFELKQMELDNIDRGSKDPDLDALEDAAKKIAHFEESAVYRGFADGGITGIAERSPYDPVPLTDEIAHVPEAVARAVEVLHQAGVHGPYALVLGVDRYLKLMQSTVTGFPLGRVIGDLIEGPLTWSPALDAGVLLSARGGDFELTIGQDLSIGYVDHNRDTVHLYFTESFTFRVIEPAAAVVLS